MWRHCSSESEIQQMALRFWNSHYGGPNQLFMKNGYDHHDHQDIYTYNLSGPKRFTLDVPNQSLPLLVTCYIRFGQTYPNFTVFYHRLQSYKCGKSAHFHAKGFVLNTRIKCGPWTQQQYQYRRHSRAIGDGNIKTDETITKSSESEL